MSRFRHISCAEAVFLYTFASMKIMELCKQERPREKMIARGANALTDVELLAILLRTGTARNNVVDVARDLIRSGDGMLREVASMSLERLCQVEGIGPGKAVAVTAAFELGRRLALETGMDGAPRLDSPAKVYRIMLPVMRDIDHEECWVLFLSKNNSLIAKERMTVGGQDFTVVDKRVVIRRAIERKASSVILVHNHPSGNPMPSVEDMNQTRDLNRALSACGLQLLDHVIVAGRSYYSFSDEKVVETSRLKTPRLVADKK
jgi:DNA repair protein RadC